MMVRKVFDDTTFLDFLIHKRDEKKCDIKRVRKIFDEHTNNRRSYGVDLYTKIAITDLSEISIVAGEIMAYNHIIKEIESERFIIEE